MKNFCFDTICNITQETQDLQGYNCASGFIGKSAVIKYYQLSKVISINRRIFFDQLATDSSSNPPKCLMCWLISTPLSKYAVSAFQIPCKVLPFTLEDSSRT